MHWWSYSPSAGQDSYWRVWVHRASDVTTNMLILLRKTASSPPLIVTTHQQLRRAILSILWWLLLSNLTEVPDVEPPVSAAGGQDGFVMRRPLNLLEKDVDMKALQLSPPCSTLVNIIVNIISIQRIKYSTLNSKGTSKCTYKSFKQFTITYFHKLLQSPTILFLKNVFPKVENF